MTTTGLQAILTRSEQIIAIRRYRNRCIELNFQPGQWAADRVLARLTTERLE
jgi:hypothetical protein